MTYYTVYVYIQDTVVALQALSMMASQIYTNNVDMSLKVDTTYKVHDLDLNAQNMDVLQIVEV